MAKTLQCGCSLELACIWTGQNPCRSSQPCALGIPSASGRPLCRSWPATVAAFHHDIRTRAPQSWPPAFGKTSARSGSFCSWPAWPSGTRPRAGAADKRRWRLPEHGATAPRQASHENHASLMAATSFVIQLRLKAAMSPLRAATS